MASETHRWNVERDGSDLLICEGDHEKHEGCTYARYVPATTHQRTLEALEFDAERLAKERDEAREEVERYKIALADATRRPMGVLPASAEGLITTADMEAAEKRRPKHATLTKEPTDG